MCAFSNFRIVFYINKYKSPEQATSLLAGGGRGAAGAGSISMGIPPEERGSDDTSQTNDEWTLTSIGTPQESVEIERARSHPTTSSRTLPGQSSLLANPPTMIKDSPPQALDSTQTARHPRASKIVTTRHTTAAGEPICFAHRAKHRLQTQGLTIFRRRLDYLYIYIYICTACRYLEHLRRQDTFVNFRIVFKTP